MTEQPEKDLIKEEKIMNALSTENTKTKLERSIAENKLDTIKAKKAYLEIQGFFDDINNKLKAIENWNTSKDSLEKSREDAYKKLVDQENYAIQHANILVTSLLGFIDEGRLSQYRDLDQRLNRDEILLLEYVVQELKTERGF
jgi:hypothetical protein